jgi:hypothetical protein
MDLGIICFGDGAIFTTGPSVSSPSHCLQVYLGRICFITRITAGITSSFSELSSPIRSRVALEPQAFSASSMSCTTSTLGKAAGNFFLHGFFHFSSQRSGPGEDGSVHAAVRFLFRSCAHFSRIISFSSSGLSGNVLAVFDIRKHYKNSQYKTST